MSPSTTQQQTIMGLFHRNNSHLPCVSKWLLYKHLTVSLTVFLRKDCSQNLKKACPNLYTTAFQDTTNLKGNKKTSLGNVNQRQRYRGICNDLIRTQTLWKFHAPGQQSKSQLQVLSLMDWSAQSPDQKLTELSRRPSAQLQDSWLTRLTCQLIFLCYNGFTSCWPTLT